MKKKITLYLLLAMIMLSFSAYAVKDFSIDPTSITSTEDYNISISGTIAIENTGNETINISINGGSGTLDLSDGSNTITVNLDSVLLSDLNDSDVVNLGYNFSTEVSAGTYTGDLLLEVESNSSINNTVSFSITVNAPPSTASFDFEIEDVSSTIRVYGELDDTVSKIIVIKNTGNETLTDFQFEVTDLDGETEGDDIADSRIDFITDDGFDLDPDDDKSFKFEIDVPSNIEIDVYEGEFEIKTDQITKTYDLRVTIEGGEYKIEVKENSLSVKNGVMTIYGEPGEYVTDYEFTLDNDGDFEVRDIYFTCDDLEEEFSGDIIDNGQITFNPSTLDLDNGDDDDIKVKVRIPTDAKTGDYYGDVDVFNSEDEKLDSFTLKVKVIGDLYIVDGIQFSDESVKPGEDLTISMKLKNKGGRIFRNVKIYGIIYDVDSINSDLDETTETFIIDINDEIEKVLHFNIPDDASDGTKTVEIRVEYDDGTINELETFTVVRNLHDMQLMSSLIRPKIAECNNEMYAYISAENLGKSDEDVKFTIEIVGTGITAETGFTVVSPDENYEKSLVVDISELAPGNYKVVNKIVYQNSLFKKFETNLQVKNCTDGQIIINPIISGNGTHYNETGDVPSTIEIFGNEYETITFYLAVGLGSMIVLIIIFLALL